MTCGRAYLILLVLFIPSGCSTNGGARDRHEVGFVSQKGIEAALEDPGIKENAIAIGANEPELENLREEAELESKRIAPNSSRRRYQFTGPSLGVSTRP